MSILQSIAAQKKPAAPTEAKPDKTVHNGAVSSLELHDDGTFTITGRIASEPSLSSTGKCIMLAKTGSIPSQVLIGGDPVKVNVLISVKA